MATRCKFVCNFKDDRAKCVYLVPVYSGSEENKKFFAYTPGGQLNFNTLNEAAFAEFETGKEYYIDIFRSDVAPKETP